MDPRKLMERLKGAAALTEQDVGEFSHFKGKMMKISVHSYAVEDWGSLSLLESRGMAGLMRRDMLVINSCVKDIPVLVIQYMGLFGRRMLQVHVLDVMKDKTAAGRFASLGRMAEQSGTAVQETPVEWYTPMQLPGSVTVTGKSSQLEQLAGDVAVSYLAAAAQVRQTGAVEGRYLRLRKLMSQLFDHGGFGYDAIRVCLQQQNTEELYFLRFVLSDDVFIQKCLDLLRFVQINISEALTGMLLFRQFLFQDLRTQVNAFITNEHIIISCDQLTNLVLGLSTERTADLLVNSARHIHTSLPYFVTPDYSASF